MISELSKTEIQAFIEEHLYDDPASLMLKASRFPGVRMAEVVEQIQSKRKAKTKLPEWFATEGVIYPPRLSMEQCSSEETARYKAALVQGEHMIDLTGGFGVDTYYLSQKFKSAHYVERSEALSEVTRHNFNQLTSNIKVHHADGLELLQKCEQPFSLIYLDPARRGDHNQKVFRFEDCEPDVVHHQALLRAKGQRVMIKASPMLEIKQGIAVLGGATEVHVVSVQNEVKELLFVLDNESTMNPLIHAVNLKAGEAKLFVFDFEKEMASPTSQAIVGQYLYEPNAAIMKAGAFNTISQVFPVDKLHTNTHLYTANELVADFPGRAFKVLDKLSMNKKVIKKHFPAKQAHITTRNFPMTVAQIRKKTGLKEGGDQYIIGLTDESGPQLLHCQRL